MRFPRKGSKSEQILGTDKANAPNSHQRRYHSYLGEEQMIKTEILLGCAIFLICASAVAQRQGTPGICPPGAICGTNSTRGNDDSYTSGRAVPNIKDAGSADPE